MSSIVGPVDLSCYFNEDDGSLPEIEVAFGDSALVPLAFKHLYERGARNVTVNGGYVWIKASQADRPFSGPEDALLVVAGEIDAFHVVLGSITGAICQIPDLGVFVFAEGLLFDYRMGADWGQAEIHSLLSLLRQLQKLGGSISVRWWGADGERDFLDALARTDPDR